MVADGITPQGAAIIAATEGAEAGALAPPTEGPPAVEAVDGTACPARAEKRARRPSALYSSIQTGAFFSIMSRSKRARRAPVARAARAAMGESGPWEHLELGIRMVGTAAMGPAATAVLAARAGGLSG